MIDDQVHRTERIDLLWVPAEHFDGVAHCGEVDDGRHAGKVLKQDINCKTVVLVYQKRSIRGLQ